MRVMSATRAPQESSPVTASSGDLKERICLARDARELLSHVNFVASAIISAGHDDYILSKARIDARDSLLVRAELGESYKDDAVISKADAGRVYDFLVRANYLVQYDARTVGSLAVQEAMKPLADLVSALLAQKPCRIRAARAWWLIPFVLIGTSLVVWGETKTRPGRKSR